MPARINLVAGNQSFEFGINLFPKPLDAEGQEFHLAELGLLVGAFRLFGGDGDFGFGLLDVAIAKALPGRRDAAIERIVGTAVRFTPCRGLAVGRLGQRVFSAGRHPDRQGRQKDRRTPR